jgi:hypothetical protein
MKLKTSTVLWTFIWCLFMGITVGSIGIGAIYPPANLMAGPFVCPGGQMQVVTKEYHPSPIQTVTTLTWYCVDGKTGAKTELSILPMSLYAGTIYGLAFFLVVFIGMGILANRRPAQQDLKSEAHEALQESIRLRKLAQLKQEKYEDLLKRIEAELDREKNRN